MKKDITIPEVTDIQLAVALHYNTMFKIDDWNIYLINNKLEPLEQVLIVSNGFDNQKKTATFRHKLEVLPAKSYAKVEFMLEELLSINNEFKITFFIENTLYEKTFLIKKNTVSSKTIKLIPILNCKGVIIE